MTDDAPSAEERREQFDLPEDAREDYGEADLLADMLGEVNVLLDRFLQQDPVAGYAAEDYLEEAQDSIQAARSDLERAGEEGDGDG